MFRTEIVQKIKTHILCSKLFSENYVVYEIMWANKNTKHIVTYPLQQWLRERSIML